MATKVDPKKSFLSYIRVSSDRQASEGASLDEQKRRNRDYAQSKKFTIYKEYVEVESASDNNRPIFHQMIKEAKKLKVCGFIFNKVDRAARNLKDQALLEDMIKDGFEMHFVLDGISTDNPNWRLMFIQFGFAKYYIENLKQEIDKGLIGRLNEGRLPLPAPVGYLDKGFGVKEPNTQTALFIKHAFELYATGRYSIVDLTEKMKRMGMKRKNGGELNKNSLHRVLRDQFYYGVVPYRGVLWPGAHKPIISKALYDKVQKVLTGKGYKRIWEHVYIFQGMLPCPNNCGRLLRSMTSKKIYRYYRCRTKGCEFSVKESDLEKQFLEQLQKLEFNNDEVNLFLKALQSFRSDLKSLRETEIAQIDMGLDKNTQMLEAILEKNLQKQITDEEYVFMKNSLINKKVEFQERRQALDKAEDEIMNQIAEIGKLLKKPSLAYQKSVSEEGKRNLMKSLVANFSLNGKKLIVNWKKPFDLVAERNQFPFGGAGGNCTRVQKSQ